MAQVFANKVWTPSARDVARQQTFIQKTLDNVGKPALQELIEKACQSLANTHSPYSNYPVGAAVLTTSGNMYAGTNVENANYTLTVHAEQNAINAALMAGEHLHNKNFVRVIAVVSSSRSKIHPCGGCRQVIAEQCKNTVIIGAHSDGKVNVISSLQTIFPLAFTPAALGK